MNPQGSRREFLSGKASPDPAHSGSPPNDATEGSYVVRVTRRAMACEFAVCLNAGQYEHDTQVALEALDLVEALEDQMSVFRPHSEICRVNRDAARRPVHIEAGLFGLIELAVQLQRETSGAFDLSAGPLWEIWGFARRAGRLPTDAQLAEAMQCVGSHLIELDVQQQTIRFAREGVRLNLGSIGKGYALDRCAEKLHQAGMADFLLHGGQSSVLARGSRRQPRHDRPQPPAEGWQVGLPDPLHPGRRLAEIRLSDRALATSGSRAQSFVHKGRRYGHILDPRSGRPAEGVLSATAIAPGAALADALSTAFYVMGPEASLEYCRTRPEIAAVLLCPIRRSGRLEVHTIGLAEEELKLLSLP